MRRKVRLQSARQIELIRITVSDQLGTRRKRVPLHVVTRKTDHPLFRREDRHLSRSLAIVTPLRRWRKGEEVSETEDVRGLGHLRHVRREAQSAERWHEFLAQTVDIWRETRLAYLALGSAVGAIDISGDALSKGY